MPRKKQQQKSVHDDAITNAYEKALLEKARYEFSSLASHQLRTPLSALRWIMDMFASGRAGNLTDFQQELITDAKSCILNMGNTIRSLFLITQLESSNMPIEKKECEIKPLLKEVLKKCREATKKNNVDVVIECKTNLFVVTDRNILQEVLNNLLENALNYSPDDGDDVVVSAFIDSKKLVIEIHDHGYGIPKAEQSRIFTKFYRGTNITKKQTDGNGLGLYVVSGLVDLLGGTIHFVSEENKGTTFTVEVPVS